MRKVGFSWQQGEKISQSFLGQCLPWQWLHTLSILNALSLLPLWTCRSFQWVVCLHEHKPGVPTQMPAGRPAPNTCRVIFWTAPHPKRYLEGPSIYSYGHLSSVSSSVLLHAPWAQPCLKIRYAYLQSCHPSGEQSWKETQAWSRSWQVLSGYKILELWHPVCGSRREMKALVEQFPLTWRVLTLWDHEQINNKVWNLQETLESCEQTTCPGKRIAIV
jgi:hypothetical protein